jgi:hypothetical protein
MFQLGKDELSGKSQREGRGRGGYSPFEAEEELPFRHPNG